MAVVVHTHETTDEGEELFPLSLRTSTESFAGSLGVGGAVDFALSPYAFFPMIHCTSSMLVWRAHATDAVDPDSPRFGLRSFGSNSGTYDVDYRYIES